MQGTEGARYGVSMSGPECDGRRVTGAGDPRRRRAGRNSEGSRDSPGHARAYSGPPISWARRAAKDVSAEASPVLAWGSKRGFCQAAGVRRLRHVLRTSWGRDAGETRVLQRCIQHSERPTSILQLNGSQSLRAQASQPMPHCDARGAGAANAREGRHSSLSTAWLTASPGVFGSAISLCPAVLMSDGWLHVAQTCTRAGELTHT